MYVKLLIGQRAGQVVDMPDHAATNLLMTGQALKPTGAEIAATVEADRKAMMPKSAPDVDEPGTVIHEIKRGKGAGLKIVAASEGRFNVIGIGGAILNDAPLARSEALLFVANPPAKAEGALPAPAAETAGADAGEKTSPKKQK